ncbi:MAG: hypothetical protein AAB443_04330 [Patescibacteria group bacterium]
MVDAASAFSKIASFLLTLGILICLPIGIAAMYYSRTHEFDSDNAKRKFTDIGHLFLILFAASALPTLLLKILGQ